MWLVSFGSLNIPQTRKSGEMADLLVASPLVDVFVSVKMYIYIWVQRWLSIVSSFSLLFFLSVSTHTFLIIVLVDPFPL